MVEAEIFEQECSTFHEIILCRGIWTRYFILYGSLVVVPQNGCSKCTSAVEYSDRKRRQKP